MKSSNQYTPNLSFGVLVKGAPKVGKTVLALLFPNPYIADCDNNLGGAVRYLRQYHPSREFRFDTININDDGSLVPADKRWARLVECCKVAAKDPWVRTLIVDSATAIDTYLQDHILANKDDKKEKDRMAIADWVPYRNMLTNFITTFRSVNKFFIMTAHEITEKDELSGRMVYKPSISSKLQNHFGGFFSDEWYCAAEERAGEIIRTVSSTPEPIRSAGTSLELPVKPWKFDWDKLAEHMARFNEAVPSKTK